jgi:hypothetical protein
MILRNINTHKVISQTTGVKNLHITLLLYFRDFYFRALGSLVVLSFPQPLNFNFPQFSPRSSLKPLADARTGGIPLS